MWWEDPLPRSSSVSGCSISSDSRSGRAPPTGYCNFFHAQPDCGGALDWLSHVIVPAALLALFPAVVYARLVREGRSLIRKSKEPERAARRLALPLARVVGRDFGFLIGAAVFVEAAFSLPGLGQMVASGTVAYDRLAVGPLSSTRQSSRWPSTSSST